ncbi:ribonuclease T2 isoform X2 [Chelonoidis abingdonii]|uniref:ribonuclease T2 isoform X2 n=1 Tax=Chelonoidis abingdonii TaxID=106734 RepID=UPI003F497BA2
MVPGVSADHPPWLRGAKAQQWPGYNPVVGAGFNAGCSGLLTEVASCDAAAVSARQCFLLCVSKDQIYILNKMKPATGHYLILGCFCLAFYSGCTSYKFLESEQHPHTWKKLFLVHHWPVTVCKMSENDCNDPPQYWTIHGLWPDKVDECNRTWHFNVTEIQDLLPDMRHYWPDVLHSSHNRTQFCCLLKVGIKPSSTYYQMRAIKEALTSVYGVTPKVQCLPPEEGEEVQTIGQIEFCFTKELELRNCTNSEAESYVMPNNWHFGSEELSVCNDTLTYYPAQVQFYN